MTGDDEFNLDDEFEDEDDDENENENENDDGSNNSFNADDPVARLLRQLQSSGAVIKRTKVIAEDYQCKVCDVQFDDYSDFHEHTLTHVSQPSVVVEKIDDDDEWDEDEWSSDSEAPENFEEDAAPKSPNMKNAIDIFKFLGSNSGITIKSNKQLYSDESLAALKNMSNLSIRKINPQANYAENVNCSPPPDVWDRKSESSGTLKMTIKHTTDNGQFEVVNGAPRVEDPLIPIVNDFYDSYSSKSSKDDALDKVVHIKSEPDFPIDIIEADDLFEPDKNAEDILDNFNVKPETSPRSHTPQTGLGLINDSIEAKSGEISVEKLLTELKDDCKTTGIIEIGCDSDKDDDEIIFVSSGQSVNKKVTSESIVDNKEGVIPKNIHASPPRPNCNYSTEKQHNFNWNAPAKNSLESLLTDKSTDALFESLLSNHRKDTNSDFNTNEYISLDKLGPQHTCETCNTRFTSIELLESHKRITGHSNTIVASNSFSNKSMALSPYQQSDFLMNSILPMKQLADTVSKITSHSNPSTSGAFTHQQNIMVNIQSFPGGMGGPSHGAPSNYNYPAIPHMPSAFPPPPHTGYTSGYPGQYHTPSYHNPYNPFPPQPPPYSAPPQHYPQNQYVPQNIPISNPYASQSGFGSSQGPPVHSNNPHLPPSSSSVGQQNVDHNMTTRNIPHDTNKLLANGIKIQGSPANGPPKPMSVRMPHSSQAFRTMRGGSRCMIRPGYRPMMNPAKMMPGQAVRGIRPLIRGPLKRPAPTSLSPQLMNKKRMDVLIPNKHDNEECQVVSLQQQKEGLPVIHSIQGSRAPNTGIQLNSQITWTKTKIKSPTPVQSAKYANDMASILAARGIKITPSPKPNTVSIPNLGSGISVTPAKVSSNFAIPEKNELQCSVCTKMFLNNSSLVAHMSQAHPSTKLYRCDHCPVAYPTFYQLSEHKKAFHNVPNAEMGLPVVDLSQHSTIRKLNHLGITNFIPLANRDQGNGCFGIPIVSTQNAMNGTVSNALNALGANGILSFGPVKQLPKC